MSLINSTNLHPDDVLFYLEVTRAMKRVAKNYELPLRSIEGYPMPLSGMADRMGDCNHAGHIRLVMRCTVDGQYCDEPLSPNEVWHTAAHELAHLRCWNHGHDHDELTYELEQALKHQQVDHRQKVLDKLVKMQAARQGEAEIGNTAAAEAFASAINRMLVEYELNPSDIDYARATDHDPIVEMRVDLTKYRIKSKLSRIAWQEELARIVAKAHLCSFLVQPRTNNIYFVGTTSHATVAEYVYGTLVPATDKMATREHWRYAARCERAGDLGAANGYKSSWLSAFVTRISERFEEIRKQAVSAPPEGVSSSQALMRLDGALVRVRQYIDDRFSTGRNRIGGISHRGGYHKDGRAHGRAAADRMVLGRKGLTNSKTPKQLKG